MAATQYVGDIERDRLAALQAYEVLDTEAEHDFDDIVMLAAQLCDKPIALISLIDADRQWFKARYGTDLCEGPRAGSICSHAMYDEDVLQVCDARRDPRFAACPTVTGAPHIRFYAGAPLISPLGKPLGTLCVADPEPGRLTDAQRHGLRVLARHVVTQLELRKYARDVHALHQRVQTAEQIKDEFIARVNHEFRTPLTSIHGYLEMLGDPELPTANRDGFLQRVQRNSDRLLALVDDMLLAAQVNAESREFHRVPADLAVLARTSAAANRPLAEAKGLSIVADAAAPVFADVDPRRMGQALERLILNAIKFTATGTITVTAASRDGRSMLLVQDTGIGISPADQARVLAPFRRSADAERAEVQGLGLGLSIVKAITEGHEGEVTIVSSPGQGTTIALSLPAAGPYPEL
ncbi:sensor histidine kinase and response regulator of a two component complex [Actinoplanes sp. SE50]|uniref:GAF domain-containing sensor histidine kinase n=1 Tax=unclassified Actinoplanes TaxID=2626549 RepID=UPI00023EBCF4|nr:MULTISPECIES: GAF domain-containing sensor histidine kinase [unclassified Actinoplanes]AEV82910.1 sensor histidine kinase and response regulator of a two component complex [Actinoplanes sp. SE50/110]ATO81306.1 sensor histidine kinase and response regulator of a two component complex [Actinoplanes sp. SE50]SLL98713.1 hybrid sensor histidine kinase and response regulator of a two component complex [Actinoplanes sp. SE50/110]